MFYYIKQLKKHFANKQKHEKKNQVFGNQIFSPRKTMKKI